MSGLTIRPEPALAVALTGVLLGLNEIPRPPELAVSWIAIVAATSAVFWTLFAVHASFWWAALPATVLAAAGVASLIDAIPDARGAWTPLHLIALLAIGATASVVRRRLRRHAVRLPVRASHRHADQRRQSLHERAA
ncbi:hypothetical protein [Microcella alkaliphila]|uniref:Transglutaminase-like enzyme, predicted cysteine protease n=1 Tax=Microcella alkaliphila TaxID=279828 RepID=A0A0U5BK02_9MICO|nr:hypothetical protein [Microcella alkaliphila]BAU33454.1 transglutaminase-like enzyme, predicted cysteine protease [Microcella alkaliphila]